MNKQQEGGYQSNQTILTTIDFPFQDEEVFLYEMIYCHHPDKDYVVAITSKDNNNIYYTSIIPSVYVGELYIDPQHDGNIKELQLKTIGRFPLIQNLSHLIPLKKEKSFLICGAYDLRKVDLENGNVIWEVRTKARFCVQDERGIIYCVSDIAGTVIHLRDCKTGQVLNKIKIGNFLVRKGFGYDEFNQDFLLGTSKLNSHYQYLTYHVSKQGKIVSQSPHLDPPNYFISDVFNKKIYLAKLPGKTLDCFDMDYKEKRILSLPNSFVSFFLFKKCKYLVLVAEKKLVILD